MSLQLLGEQHLTAREHTRNDLLYNGRSPHSSMYVVQCDKSYTQMGKDGCWYPVQHFSSRLDTESVSYIHHSASRCYMMSMQDTYVTASVYISGISEMLWVLWTYIRVTDIMLKAQLFIKINVCVSRLEKNQSMVILVKCLGQVWFQSKVMHLEKPCFLICDGHLGLRSCTWQMASDSGRWKDMAWRLEGTDTNATWCLAGHTTRIIVHWSSRDSPKFIKSQRQT